MRTIELGEADLIVAFLTRDKGRLKGVAKGARRSRRRFVNCLDVFSLVEMQYKLNNTSNLNFLESARLIDSFSGIRSSYSIMAVASFMIELIENLLPWELPDLLMFDLLKKTFSLLTSFPQTDVFEFETIGDVTYNEDTQEDDGGKFYNISLSFKIGNYSEIEKLLKRNVRAVVFDRNANYRLLGTFNGLFCTKITKETGSNKSDFNGFKIDFEGKELRESLFFTDLEIITGAQSFLLQENGDFLLQENGFKIVL